MDSRQYEPIVDRLKSGNLIPFLGAGVCMVGRHPGERWGPGKGFLPSGSELAEELSGMVGLPGETRLDRVAQQAFNGTDPSLFQQKLREFLGVNCKPNGLHELLADLSSHIRLFVTTNYDTMLERALNLCRTPYVRVFHAPDNKMGATYFGWTESSNGAVQLRTDDEIAREEFGKRTVVFKMHGTLFDEAPEDGDYGFVITEDDYTEFLSRMPIPRAFFPQLVKSSFLFLGCSLEDPDLRVLLRMVSKHRGVVRSWAIQRRPTERKKQKDRAVWDVNQKLWEERKVQVLDVDITEFATEFGKQAKEALRP